MELTERYERGWAAFQVHWAHIDAALSQLVLSVNEDSWEDVHVKVVFVDGVYQSELARTLGERPHERVAKGLFHGKGQLSPLIDGLACHVGFDLEVLSEVVTAHATVLQNLGSPDGGGRKAGSFASKYLHFHAVSSLFSIPWRVPRSAGCEGTPFIDRR